MGWLAGLQRTLTRFLHDRRGAAGLEFVAASPLLFGAMVLTAEYGQALRYRLALDGAVRDAAHFLARAPALPVAGNPGGSIAFPDAFLDEADGLLDRRLGREVAVAIGVTTHDGARLRAPVHMVEITGSMTLDLPLLGMIDGWGGGTSDGTTGGGLRMAAVQRARWAGATLPAGAPCRAAAGPGRVSTGPGATAPAASGPVTC